MLTEFGSKYPLHSLFVSNDQITTVTAKPSPESQLLLSVQQLQGDYEMLQTVLHQIPLSEHIVSTDISVKSGVLAWREFGDLKVLVPRGEFPRPAAIALADDVTGWDVAAAGNTVVVQLKTASASSAEVWKFDGKRLQKAFSIPARDGEHTSTFSVSSKEGKEFIVWTLTSGETILYGDADSSATPLATYPAAGTLSGPHLSAAISEVLARADGTYALRTFLTAAAPGFAGDSHLIRNGEIAWHREESLASIVASTWLELLDPTTEEIVDELKVETHQNFIAAYVHRVIRHAHELVVYGPAWAAGLPKRLLNAFLSIETKSEAVGKWRDFFGFRKFLIVVTEEGGVAALDVSKQGAVVWRASLQAPDVEYAGITEIWTVRKGVVGIVLTTGYYDEFDGFTGMLVGQTALDEKVKETAIVPTAEGSAIIAVLASGKVTALPIGTELEKPVYIVTRRDTGAIEGLKISPDLSSTVTWSFAPPASESITSLTSRPAHDPVASIGRVLGDRSVMYKYINPHLLAVTTVSEASSSASLYILDSISGALLHSATHTDVDTSLPLLATVSENFVVYTYFSIGGTVADGAQSHNLVVAELYESAHPNDRGVLAANTSVSSFKTAGSKPYTYTQSFIFPTRITNLAVTHTKQGITSHNILLTLPAYRGILAVPKRILDPRRPVNRDPDASEREEGLARYVPVIEVDPRSMITHERAVFGTKKVVTSPSDLESTSLVVGWGGDVFGTREAPSLVFDLLGKGFGKLQLVGTVLACAVGVVVVAPMVRRKGINQRWRA